MSSDVSHLRPAWMRLAWWYEQDARVKEWFARLGRDERSWPENARTRAVMLLCHAIGWPCLLTPLVTRWLYPWLPQPDAALFYLWAATNLGGALLASLKLNDALGRPTPRARMRWLAAPRSTLRHVRSCIRLLFERRAAARTRPRGLHAPRRGLHRTRRSPAAHDTRSRDDRAAGSHRL